MPRKGWPVTSMTKGSVLVHKVAVVGNLLATTAKEHKAPWSESLLRLNVDALLPLQKSLKPACPTTVQGKGDQSICMHC